MHVGKRLLLVLVLMGLAACGEPDTSFGATPELESTSAAEMSTPVEGQSSTETTVIASGQDSASITLVTQASTTSTLAQPPVSTTTASGTSGQYDPALRPYVDQAVADLASRLGSDPSSIMVVSAEIIVWPDAALGCPQPGMAYTQVPVDGSLIKLSSHGVEYSYHTGGRVSTPFLCENQK